MIRPTPRAGFLFAMLVPLTIVLVVATRPSLWTLALDFAILAMAAIATDAALSPARRHIALAAHPPERLFVGEAGTVRVAVDGRLARRRAALHVLLEGRGPIDAIEPQRAILSPGNVHDVACRIAPRRRGKVFVDAVWLRWDGPFGLVRRIVRTPVDGEIDVVPNVRGAQTMALQFFAKEAVQGVRVERQRGEGTEFESLREYVPGLDPRHIDWKRSARHRKLVAKEFQSERNHPLVLAFDTGHLMGEPIGGLARLDHAINAGLVLGWIALRGGDIVGGYGFDSRVRAYLAPARGLSRFANLLSWTAELAYGTEETNFTLGLAELSIRMRRRALVVVFTDFVDTVTAELMIESLQRIANRHVVVLVTLRDEALDRMAERRPDRFETLAEAVFIDDFARERTIVLERLARMGLHTIDVPATGVSIALINRYLEIKQRGLM